MKRDPIIGEWQTDKWGRRYRVVNTFGVPMIEHEMEVTTTAGNLPSSRIGEAEKAKQRRLEEIEREREAQKGKRSPKRCAFSQTGRFCKDDCAFYGADGCMRGSEDTKGKKCPVNPYICGDECKLYNDGCELIKFIKGDR